jgi:hypothetical protein
MSIRNKATVAMAKQVLKLKKNAPHILFGAGLVGVTTSAVMACRATLKLEPVLDEIKTDIDMPKDREITPDYSERERQRDVAFVYIRSTGRLARLYGPAILVGSASLAALTTSHVQMTRRNTALTAAYAGLHTAFVEYRARVRDEVGEEKEQDIYRGVTYEQSKEVKGKLAKLPTVDPNKLSPYALIFDEGNPNWSPNAEFNKVFIKCQQNYANDRLISRGFIFLNEVLNDLGFPPTHAGQYVGWMMNDGGDNYVDFGLFEAHQSGFLAGVEPSIILDFNVDGVIIDKVL